MQKVNKHSIDLVITSIPRVEPHTPLLGPSILKAILVKNGFSVKVEDYNIKIWHQLKSEKSLWGVKNSAFDFSNEKLFSELWERTLKKITAELLLETLKENPTWIGLTYFSEMSGVFTKSFCALIRKLSPLTKILIGGPGATKWFCESELKNKGLVDVFFLGEADESLLAFFKGEEHPGINGWAPQVENLDDVPVPDYSDLDFSLYVKPVIDDTWREDDSYNDDDLGLNTLNI